MKTQSISRRNPRLEQISSLIVSITALIKFLIILAVTSLATSAFLIGALFLIHGPTEFFSRWNFILETLARYGYL